MSELRSVVEELRSETLPELPDALIEEDLAELQSAVEQLEVERLRRLAEIDRRRLFERDGYLSAASWLATRFKVSWGAACLGVAARDGAGRRKPGPGDGRVAADRAGRGVGRRGSFEARG